MNIDKKIVKVLSNIIQKYVKRELYQNPIEFISGM
jgi:hypothetical protein